MARNYSALPYEYLEEMSELTDAEFGRLTRALLKYSMTGEPIALCGNERYYAKRVMSQEDRFKDSYEETTDRKRAAGKKGADKRWGSKNSDAIKNDGKNGCAISDMADDSKNGNTETKTNTKTETNTPPSTDGRSDVPDGVNDFGAVMSAYMDKINATPSGLAIAEIRDFVEIMGKDCCLRAISIAQDEKKTSWSYVRGILKAKRNQGVRNLADWDRVDEQREAQKAAKNSRNAGWEPGKPREPSAAEQEQAKQDMERTRRLLAMMKEGE